MTPRRPTGNEAVLHSHGRWRAASNVGVVVLFLSMLWLPCVGQLSGIGTSNELTENRRASPFPKFEWKHIGPVPWPHKRSLQAFPAAFEAFYNDHFGFRRPLLRCYNLAVVGGCMPGLMASSAGKPRPETPALIGQKGWIYSTKDEDIETYRCARPFTALQLERWSQVLLERRAWLKQRGTHYLFVVPPSKPTIYPEYLPRAINRVGRESRVDQMAAALRQHQAAEMFLDLRDAILAAKHQYSGCPCYYRTDTHWNEFGGYHGYRALMSKLKQWYPSVQASSLAEFNLHWQEGRSLVLAELLDTAELFTDTHVSFQPHLPRKARIVAERQGTQAVPTCVVENPDAPLGCAVVLHDSFMLAMQPFFNEHFRHVHYFWTREFPISEIERLQPELVIQEMVEQLVTAHQPGNPAGMYVPARPLEMARRNGASTR